MDNQDAKLKFWYLINIILNILILPFVIFFWFLDLLEKIFTFDLFQPFKKLKS